MHPHPSNNTPGDGGECLDGSDPAIRSIGDLTIGEQAHRDRPALQAGASAAGANSAHPATTTWGATLRRFERACPLPPATLAMYRESCATLDRYGLAGPAFITPREASAFLRTAALSVDSMVLTDYVAAATFVLRSLYGRSASLDAARRIGMFHRRMLPGRAPASLAIELTRSDVRELLRAGCVTRPLGLMIRLLLATGLSPREVHSATYDRERRLLTTMRRGHSANVMAIAVPVGRMADSAADAWDLLSASGAAPTLKSLARSFSAAREDAGLRRSLTLQACRESFRSELQRLAIPDAQIRKVTSPGLTAFASDDRSLIRELAWRSIFDLVDFETGFDWP